MPNYQRKKVVLKLLGVFVEIMCEVNKEYEKYVIYEGKKKVLYLRVYRTLYGCLKSALLWYNLYTNTLNKYGFVLNSCVRVDNEFDCDEIRAISS